MTGAARSWAGCGHSRTWTSPYSDAEADVAAAAAAAVAAAAALAGCAAARFGHVVSCALDLAGYLPLLRGSARQQLAEQLAQLAQQTADDLQQQQQQVAGAASSQQLKLLRCQMSARQVGIMQQQLKCGRVGHEPVALRHMPCRGRHVWCGGGGGCCKRLWAVWVVKCTASCYCSHLHPMLLLPGHHAFIDCSASGSAAASGGGDR
jgi:hypothetical protein